ADAHRNLLRLQTTDSYGLQTTAIGSTSRPAASMTGRLPASDQSVNIRSIACEGGAPGFPAAASHARHPFEARTAKLEAAIEGPGRSPIAQRSAEGRRPGEFSNLESEPSRSDVGLKRFAAHRHWSVDAARIVPI